MPMGQSLFKGYNALHEFCDFVFSVEHMGYCLIAHNAKGFDAVLTQRWLFQNRPTADMHVIHSGQKTMQLTFNDYKIRLRLFKFSTNALIKIS